MTSIWMVAATVRTVFAQTTPAETTAQLRPVVTVLEGQFPRAGAHAGEADTYDRSRNPNGALAASRAEGGEQ